MATRAPFGANNPPELLKNIQSDISAFLQECFYCGVSTTELCQHCKAVFFCSQVLFLTIITIISGDNRHHWMLHCWCSLSWCCWHQLIPTTGNMMTILMMVINNTVIFGDNLAISGTWWLLPYVLGGNRNHQAHLKLHRPEDYCQPFIVKRDPVVGR